MLTVYLFIRKLKQKALRKFISGCSNKYRYVIFSNRDDILLNFDAYYESEFIHFFYECNSEYHLIMSDDGYLIYIDDFFIDKYGVQQIGVLSALQFETAYSRVSAFRPEHYYGCVIIHSSAKSGIDNEFSLNRWLGHHALVMSIVNAYKVDILPIVNYIFPCITQMKGFDISDSRRNCYNLLKYIMTHAKHLSVDCGFIMNNKKIVNDFTQSINTDVDIIDSHLSSVTRWLSTQFSNNRNEKTQSSNISLIGKKVVIFRVEHIGDVLISYPLIDSILSSGAKSVSIVVSRSPSFIFEDDDRIDKLIKIDDSNRDVINRENVYDLLDEQLSYLCEELVDIDVAVFPQYASDITFYKHISLLLGIPYRVGIRNRIESEGGYYNILYDHMLSHCYEINVGDEHEFYRINSLAEHLELKVDLASVSRVIDKAAFVNNLPEYYIAISLGASSQNRRWPVERYMSVFHDILLKYPSLYFVILGGDDVYNSSLCLSSNMHSINFCGKLSLQEAIYVISNAKLFCGNDSGLMHLASMIGIPVVEISMHPKTGHAFHINSPKRFGPIFSPAIILQPDESLSDECSDFCTGKVAHCINEISPDEVTQSIMMFLKST